MGGHKAVMKKNIRIAVLLTCFNRKKQTLSGLDALSKQENLENVSLQVFLVDDGCTDGTGDAVKNEYPDINILHGDGTLYWNGGMRLAFGEAMKKGFDFYLFLNDDTILFPDALYTLMQSESYVIESLKRPALIAGNITDPQTSQLTYGGRISRGWKQPLYYDFVYHSKVPVPCDTANANCLLIPEEFSRKLGNLDPVFKHGKGDYDYGLRVKNAGYPVFVANAIVGNCSKNDPEDLMALKKKDFIQRWKYLTSPKQYPLIEWFIYTKRHAGIFWFIHWLRPYRHLFL